MSISLRPEDVAVLRRRAKRLHGGNVSAAVGDAAELLRIDENRQAFAAQLDRELGPFDPDVARAVLAETLGHVAQVRRRRSRAA